MPFDYPAAGGQPPAAGLTKEVVVLKPYTVKVGNYETTLMLSDEDARRQGLLKASSKAEKSAEEKQAPKPANKSRTAKNKV